MTPQADSPTWQELASGFRTLAESKPAELPPMVANLELITKPGQPAAHGWTFTFAPDVKTLAVFKHLCVQTAAKFSNLSPDVPDHTAFLSLLRCTKPEAYQCYGDGQCGYIENVCEIAAEWCAGQAERESHGIRDIRQTEAPESRNEPQPDQTGCSKEE